MENMVEFKEKVRREVNQERLYHGMTLSEINTKFYVNVDADLVSDAVFRDYARLNSTISNLWQDANKFYSDTQILHDRVKEKIRQLDEDTDLEMAILNKETVMLNRTLEKAERYSDKAREALTLAKMKENGVFDHRRQLMDLLNEYAEELAIWGEVKKKLDFISKRVDTSTMALSSEAKHFARTN